MKEEYTKLYNDLLSISVASTRKEQMAEDYVNKLYRLIETIATISDNKISSRNGNYKLKRKKLQMKKN